MARSFCAFVAAALVWGIAAVFWAPPVAAAASITVTPHENLIDGQRVTVEGSGFPANTDIAGCEGGVLDSTPSAGDCITPPFLVESSATGTFSVGYTVKRKGTSDNGAVDCMAVQCTIGAAVFSDIANTAVSTDISFNPAQIDARQKQRSTGAIRGDDIYNNLAGQTFGRTFAPGGSYTFALQVQNDGNATDDAIITAAKEPADAGHITTRYYVGYYDVTALVEGAGVRIRNLAPGQVKGLAVKISVGPDADNGELATFTLSFASAAGGGGDSLRIVAAVRTST
jgi:hypothetical protein